MDEVKIEQINVEYSFSIGDFYIDALKCCEDKVVSVKTASGDDTFNFSRSTPKTLKAIGKLLVAAGEFFEKENEKSSCNGKGK